MNTEGTTDQAETADQAETEVRDPVESQDKVNVASPEYGVLTDSANSRESVPLQRFYDVNVPVWAELGRVEMPIGEIMKLGEGAVVRLNRSVSDPVELVSQGVRLARGEVVVVDGSFAIRIRDIEPPSKRT